ncbi:uncharacterized protein PRCAT00002245001 [Priceomyces carsonii]|uniref:uncharacterized protein n=1 Tax=Priceomyces carsonii TaxID=28549 RepID=UPI002ED9E50A|nr:unnamed protein product [Priceomyces carsonii]
MSGKEFCGSILLDRYESDKYDNVDTIDIDGSVEPQLLLDDEKISRTRTNLSEISRIVSGIRDDHRQDAEDYDSYKKRGERGIVSELDIELRSNCGEDSDVAEDIEKNSDNSNGGGESEEKDVVTVRSWLMAICGMLAAFSTWGANASYGVFLNFYLSNNVFEGANQYDYALIGGIVVFFAQSLAPLNTVCFEVFGPRAVGYFAIVLQVAGYMLASFATKLWQIYLTQGVLVGLSFGFIFIPATLSLPSWFGEKKATAMGIMVSGAGFGGMVFSLSLNKIIEITGDQRWALRACGFITLATALTSVTFLVPRNYTREPLSKTFTSRFIKEKFSIIFDPKIFKDSYPLCILGAWFLLGLLGYVLMLFSYSPYATLCGLTANQGSHLVAIFNASQTIGRPVLGSIADAVGRNNLSLGICLSISILLWAFWINASTFGSLAALAVILGFIIGISSLMCQPMALDIVDSPKKLPAAWSGLNITGGLFCLVAEVIALGIRGKHTSKPFLNTQIFSGCCFFACSLLLLVNREWLIRKTFQRRFLTAKSRLKELEQQHTYLKTDGVSIHELDDEVATLQERVGRYQVLLNNSALNVLVRAFYPIRV